MGAGKASGSAGRTCAGDNGKFRVKTFMALEDFDFQAQKSHH
jgi:hypothetical protein